MDVRRIFILMFFGIFLGFSGLIFHLPATSTTIAELSIEGQLIYYYGTLILVGIFAVLTSLICVKDN